MKLTIPIIIGVLLGTASILIGQLPPAIALWGGAILFGNHFGYVLLPLVVAYINSQSWKRSFVTSTLTVLTANVVYYVVIPLLGLLDIIQFAKMGVQALESFAIWSVIGTIIGALSAAAMWFVKHGRKKFLRIGALVLTYITMLWVIYFDMVRLIIVRYNNPAYIEGGYITGYFARRNFAGDIFNVTLAYMIITVLLIIACRNVKRNEVAK